MVLALSAQETEARRGPFLDWAPSWWFLAALGAIVGLVGLASWISREFYVNYVWKYYWGPISADAHHQNPMTIDGVQAYGGYNVVNTASWALLLILLVGWAYRALAEHQETMGSELIVSIVPYMLWGSLYHVLEDSDLFAPYGLREPGTGFFDKYLGALFITPLIWLEVVFLVTGILIIGYRAERISKQLGLAKGLQFVAYLYLSFFGLYLALWLSKPAFIRFLANPIVALAAVLVAYWIVWRDSRRLGWVNPRTNLFALGIAFLLLGLYYLFVWQTDASRLWGIHMANEGMGAQPKWWVLGTLVIGVPFFSWYVSRLARGLSRPRTTMAEGERRGLWVHILLLIFLSIFGGLVLLYGSLALCNVADPANVDSPDFPDRCHDPPIAPGNEAWAVVQAVSIPVVLVLLIKLVARWGQGTLGTRPQLSVYTDPVMLLMVAGQMTDAFMTSVGIDFYGYQEKHVLPGLLIDLASRLPSPLGEFATTLVMIPLKLFIVLAVVWLIGVSAKEEGPKRDNLMGLVKLAILMVGLSPGVRDAVRVAMVT